MPATITREGEKVILWGARDVREKWKVGGAGGGGGGDRREGGAGGGGGGGKEVRDGKGRGRAKCPTCNDVCCGLARELVERMAGLEVGGKKVRRYGSVKLILLFIGCRECSKEGGRGGGDKEAGKW